MTSGENSVQLCYEHGVGSMSNGYVSSLDDDAKRYALENLNETEEKRDLALREIRRWLEEEKQDLHARLEDEYILPFLRGCKFNLEKTKAKLGNYYTMRRDRPEWFSNRNPLLPEIQELVRMGVFVPLKKRYVKKILFVLKVWVSATLVGICIYQ